MLGCFVSKGLPVVCRNSSVAFKGVPVVSLQQTLLTNSYAEANSSAKASSPINKHVYKREELEGFFSAVRKAGGGKPIGADAAIKLLKEQGVDTSKIIDLSSSIKTEKGENLTRYEIWKKYGTDLLKTLKDKFGVTEKEDLTAEERSDIESQANKFILGLKDSLQVGERPFTFENVVGHRDWADESEFVSDAAQELHFKISELLARDQLTLASELFEQHEPKNERGTSTFRLIMANRTKAADIPQVKYYAEQKIAQGSQPTTYEFNACLETAAYKGNASLLKQLVGLMEDFKVELNPQSCTHILNGLAQSGHQREALAIADDVLKQNKGDQETFKVYSAKLIDFLKNKA